MRLAVSIGRIGRTRLSPIVKLVGLLAAVIALAAPPAKAWQVDLGARCGAASPPDSAILPNGDVITVAVMWQGCVNTGIAMTRRRALDGGVVWEAQLALSEQLVLDPGSTLVDATGDVIVALFRFGFPPTSIVLKFSGTTGEEQWRFDLSTVGGTSVGSDGMALDSAGNVLVPTSDMTLPDGLNRFAVLKLSGTTGNEIWRYVADGPQAAQDRAGRVRGGALGSVIVGGYSAGTPVVIKLSPSGEELWRKNSLGFWLDPGGDLIVVEPGVLRKRSSVDGEVIWTTSLAAQGGTKLDVDAFGDVVLLEGYGLGTAPGDFVKRANADGTELWRHPSNFDVNFGWTDFRASADGHIVMAGRDFANDQAVFAKVDGSSGGVLWQRPLVAAASSSNVGNSAYYVRTGASGDDIAGVAALWFPGMHYAMATFRGADGTFAFCGDGIPGGSEECDPGGAANLCCDASCEAAASGTACDADGNVCTDDVCGGVGFATQGRCTHVWNNNPCDDGDPCTVNDACSADFHSCSGTFDVSGCVNRYMCDKGTSRRSAGGTKLSKPFPTVSVDDALGESASCTVLKEDALCAPVDQQGERPSPDAALYEQSYKVTCDSPMGVGFVSYLSDSVHQGAGRDYFQVVLLKRSGMLVPSGAIGLGPIPPEPPQVIPPAPDPIGNRFLCYKAKEEASALAERSVILTNPLHPTGSLELLTRWKVRKLCVPMSLGGDDPSATDRHRYLVCYQAKLLSKLAGGLRVFPTHASTNNTDFGTQVLKVKGAQELCVPAFHQTE